MLVALVYFFVIFATIVYAFRKYVYSYWDRRGIKSLPPTFPFGNFSPSFLQKKNIGDLIQDLANSTTEPFVGIYGAFRPILLLRDPELVRTVLVKDFNSFTDRGVHCDEKRDPLSGHLFALPSQKWRNLRGKLSPTFTSGKLKAMFSTLVDCGKALSEHMEKVAGENKTIEMRELTASHSTNVIASVAFGVEVNSIANPNTSFRKYGRQIFESSFTNGLRGACNFIWPPLMKILRLRSVDKDVEDFLITAVKQNLEHREKNNIVRKDFFQLLIQLRNSGTVQLDDEWETVIKNGENQKALTLNEVAAQSFVFFAAGFETSASTMAYCAYELAKSPKIQQQVQNEIDVVLKKYDGKITYDSVMEMKYLEWCIDETLRKYPVLPVLNRTCVQNYTIPGTDKVIEKGTEVFIPVMALHRDEKYYPEQKKFKPERFNEVNSAGKTHLDRPYLPFGDGPRNCIGMRMGKMQTKVGLVLMLQKFKYELDARHVGKELVFDPKQVLLAPIGGIHLCVSKR